MKRTLFDRFLIIFLSIFIIAFAALVVFTSYSTQNTAIKARQSSLVNEAKLIASQTVVSYFNGTITSDDLEQRFNDFEDELKVQIWLTDATGNIVAASHEENYTYLPSNVYQLDDSNILRSSFTLTGNFYDLFEKSMISVGLPILINGEFKGMLIVHSPIDGLYAMRNKILLTALIPYLVLILITTFFLWSFSKRILLPVNRINEVAKEYANGNFEAKIEIDSDDELGELASYLNDMADELQKRDQYRKDLIANISHDFRSPLTSIKGYLEAMLDGTIPQELYPKYLNTVLSESKRLTKLTEGLIELQDLDSMEMILKKKYFELTPMVESTFNTFEVQCQKKNIKLVYECTLDQTKVYADPGKIQQVIYNLIDNAIKFSPEYTSIKVSVTKKGDHLWVSVKDQGIGLDKQTQKKVWDRFYKADKSRGKDKQGTGLGLSIVKEIIKAHDEQIILNSEENVGTEFLFSLPTSNKKTGDA